MAKEQVEVADSLRVFELYFERIVNEGPELAFVEEHRDFQRLTFGFVTVSHFPLRLPDLSSKRNSTPLTDLPVKMFH
ncbi:MAG: hypothetical protein ACREQR_14655 [Candidatus Binataceae bacterium]